MTLEAFENVKAQIGYCGISCGSCVVGNGTLREFTKQYGALIRAYGVNQWGSQDVNFDQFFEALRSIERIAVCPGCRKGGGRDNCELRTCAVNMRLEACHECSNTDGCEHHKLLEHMRSGAVKAGLFVATEDMPGQDLVAKWTALLKSQWPSCILFVKDRLVG